MVNSKTRDIDKEYECPDLMIFSDDVDIETFGPFIHRGIDEAGPCGARGDVQTLASPQKIPGHIVVIRC